MKNPFPLFCLAVTSFILFSCEKEEVEPTLNSVSVSEGRTVACTTYSYFNKVSGTVDFGAAKGDLVLVRFSDGMTLQARQQLLSRFPQYHSVEGEIALDSGMLTLVRLVAATNCSDVEKLLVKLLKEPSITFTSPFFESNSTDPEEPVTGLSNEFMVSIDGSSSLPALEKLLAQTRTKIVFSFSDELHLLSADKNSTGSILDILTVFNQQTFVTVAEPNLVYSFPTTASSIGEVNFQTTKMQKK